MEEVEDEMAKVAGGSGGTDWGKRRERVVGTGVKKRIKRGEKSKGI